jgi:phage gp29-like protein
MSDVVNMSATVPEKPPAQELVTPQVLEGIHRTVLSLANAFAGVSDPTVIWTAMIRDFRSAFIYYRELEEKDDDVSSALEMLKLAVLSRDRQIMPADDSGQAQDVAKFVQEQFAQVPAFHEVLEGLLDAPGYGISVAEILYDVSAGQVGLIDIKDRPQELFSFNPQYQLQTGPLRLMQNPFAIDGGDLVPEEKFLIFTFRPRSGNRRGRPLLRRCFWPSWFKRQALRFWLRFGEKGPGTAAVMYPAGANDDEKQKALAAAEAIVEKIAIAVPENFQLVKDLLTSARSQNPAVYERLVDKMNYKIARVILGQTLTSYGNEGGTGSKAQGSVHAKMFYLKEVEVAIKLMTVINDQLVRPLVLWNFGPGAPMAKFSIDTQDEEDLVQRIGIDAQAQTMGMPITKSYMINRYGFPQAKDGDEVLTPQGSAGAISSGAAAIPSFSDDEAQHNLAEVREMLKGLGAGLGDIYKQRIHQIAEAVRGGSVQ